MNILKKGDDKEYYLSRLEPSENFEKSLISFIKIWKDIINIYRNRTEYR